LRPLHSAEQPFIFSSAKQAQAETRDTVASTSTKRKAGIVIMDEALGQSSHTTKQKKNYAPRTNIHDNISSSESSDAIPDIIELKIPTNRPFKKQGGVDKAARDDEDRKELGQ
jgi:hypothetical protein